jgi:hypothetical protein
MEAPVISIDVYPPLLVALKYAQPNSRADNGQPIQNTGYGPFIVLR